MSKKHLEAQPPSNPHDYSLGGSVAAGPEATLTIPDSPAEYAVNELALTVCGLVADACCSWAGTAAELLEAANLEGRLIGVTPQQIDRAIEDLEYLLFEFDQIQHFVLEINHNEPVRHVFLLRE